MDLANNKLAYLKKENQETHHSLKFRGRKEGEK